MMWTIVVDIMIVVPFTTSEQVIIVPFKSTGTLSDTITELSGKLMFLLRLKTLNLIMFICSCISVVCAEPLRNMRDSLRNPGTEIFHMRYVAFASHVRFSRPPGHTYVTS